MKKKLCALLTVLLLLFSLFGCTAPAQPEPEKVEAGELLTYRMDEKMVEDVHALIAEMESLAIAGEDWEKTDAVSQKLEEAYEEMIDQYQIAYVLYCLDQSDEKAKADYMDSLDIVTEIESAYNAMCKRVWLSETPFRDDLFADWTQEDIDRLLKYSDEIAQLEKRNAELTVEYRDMDQETWESDMIPLYNEMVGNYNRIAELYGYDNYYHYAYDVTYQRDYGPEEVETMREYVAQYLVDSHGDAMDAFYELYADMSKENRKLLDSYLEEGYTTLSENYVEKYIQNAPASARENMNSMFCDDRAVFTEYTHAYEGAFTTWIGGAPYCFFGPGYHNTETVIHELGHYYGSSFVEAWSQPMDLAETQSQGNEWMFIHFLQSQMEQELATAISEYKLLSDIGYIITFMMVDEFEEKVYSHPNAGNLTEQEYDAIMESVAERYGGIDFVCEEIMDVQVYWRYVVLESPVYYISYAVSDITAINLFMVAQEEEETAWECYIRLMGQPLEDEGFLSNVQQAGLSGPFDKMVYKEIRKRYKES